MTCSKLFGTLCLLQFGLTSSLVNSNAQSNTPEWSGWGGGINNNRWVPDSAVCGTTATNLTEHCHLSYPFGVSAPPAVCGNMAYYSTWNGTVVALDYTSCSVHWQNNITDVITSYAPLSAVQLNATAPVSRTTPQVDSVNGVLYVATQTHALFLALDLQTGILVGQIQINPHPVAILTQSPTLHNGHIFIGSSSAEESAAVIPTYPCCSFVGNFAALTFSRTNSTAGSFSVSWNITMLPQPQGLGGWSGAGVWGSQPSIDTVRNQVFIGTGNVYEAPPAIQACQNATDNGVANASSCLPPNVWQESVLAIDISSGNVNWFRQLSPLDAWTVACGLPNALTRNFVQCPETPGPDADFGMAPTFVPSNMAGTPNNSDAVVVGQKNGNLYALDAASGNEYWAIAAAPDGTLGGLSWGIAVDDSKVYFTAINNFDSQWYLQPSNISITHSAWGAANLSTGVIVWETAIPGNISAEAPPSVAEDVVLVQSAGVDLGTASARSAVGAVGSLFALNKQTGSVLVEYPLDAVGSGGIAVQGDYVMFGTGYHGVPATGSFYVLKVGNMGH